MNMSGLITDQNVAVRKEFSILLRVCNHEKIKWRKICNPQRIMASLTTETNEDVVDILIGLLKYRYFDQDKLGKPSDLATFQRKI